MILDSYPFDPYQEEMIVEAIHLAELDTSGEIRVHIEKRLKKHISVEELSMRLFDDLGMKKTVDRNGILIVLSLRDHQFALVGDKGIHDKVGQEFWDEVRDRMAACFKRGDLLQGLVAGVRLIGERLKEHYPYHSEDKNELSNEISIG